MRIRLRVATLGVALMELRKGVREVGQNNWGPAVSTYLKNADIHVPAPWCAAFVQWCSDEARKLQRMATNPLDEVKLEAYCPSYAEWGVRKGFVTGAPQPGDIVLYNLGGSRWDHMGIYEKGYGQGRFSAIEGNTNDDGSREGYEVARKTRKIVPGRTMFLNWDKDNPYDAHHLIVRELQRAGILPK